MTPTLALSTALRRRNTVEGLLAVSLLFLTWVCVCSLHKSLSWEAHPLILFVNGGLPVVWVALSYEVKELVSAIRWEDTKEGSAWIRLSPFFSAGHRTYRNANAAQRIELEREARKNRRASSQALWLPKAHFFAQTVYWCVLAGPFEALFVIAAQVTNWNVVFNGSLRIPDENTFDALLKRLREE